MVNCPLAYFAQNRAPKPCLPAIRGMNCGQMGLGNMDFSFIRLFD